MHGSTGRGWKRSLGHRASPSPYEVFRVGISCLTRLRTRSLPAPLLSRAAAHRWSLQRLAMPRSAEAPGRNRRSLAAPPVLRAVVSKADTLAVFMARFLPVPQLPQRLPAPGAGHPGPGRSSWRSRSCGPGRTSRRSRAPPPGRAGAGLGRGGPLPAGRLDPPGGKARRLPREAARAHHVGRAAVTAHRREVRGGEREAARAHQRRTCRGHGPLSRSPRGGTGGRPGPSRRTCRGHGPLSRSRSRRAR